MVSRQLSLCVPSALSCSIIVYYYAALSNALKEVNKDLLLQLHVVSGACVCGGGGGWGGGACVVGGHVCFVCVVMCVLCGGGGGEGVCRLRLVNMCVPFSLLWV